MTLWATLARAETASGDDILLRQRGGILDIRYNGIELTSNLNHQPKTSRANRAGG